MSEVKISNNMAANLEQQRARNSMKKSLPKSIPLLFHLYRRNKRNNGLDPWWYAW